MSTLVVLCKWRKESGHLASTGGSCALSFSLHLSLSLRFLLFIDCLLLFCIAVAAIAMASLHLNNKDIADVELTEARGMSESNAAKVFDDGISHVPEKYRGTSADKRDMTVMGKKQVLRVGIPSEIEAV